MNPVGLTTLPAELFPIVASLVPLRSAPGALRALALGNRRFYQICRALLYSRVILRNEDDAIAVIQRIMDEPQLGLCVTELYIMSELSVKARKGKKAFEVVTGLKVLVAKGLIPRITALGLYLLKGWAYDEHFNPISRGRLLAGFWVSLRNECPRLRTLILRNVGHGVTNRWVTAPVIDEINNLSNLSVLRLEWIQSGGPEYDDASKILNNLPRLASSLHTLSLRGKYGEATALFSLDIPHLKFLRLQNFACRDTAIVHGFLKRHPQLERLSFEGCLHAWFSDNIEVGVLPKLQHLKARFKDIRFFVPILPQLVSLGFTESYNCQVPYLLRVVFPNGLPQLRSLEIEHDTVGWDTWDQHALEGALWYETPDGQFRVETNPKKMKRHCMDGYMHSIVSGAPNLEELGLHGMYLTSALLKSLNPTLSKLTQMERFYYEGFSPNPKHADVPHLKTHKKLVADFLASAEALARVCTRLESVTSISGKTLPYVSGAIERNSVGEVTAVRKVDGVGMLISADKADPFPCNSW